MKKWGIIFAILFVAVMIFVIQRSGAFNGATKAKVKNDVTTIQNNFQAAISDGSTPSDSKAWTTDIDISRWQLVGEQIMTKLPQHPLNPNEKYHYKVWTDKSGRKHLAVWARYKESGEVIYCNNKKVGELSGSNLIDDTQANLACENN